MDLLNRLVLVMLATIPHLKDGECQFLQAGGFMPTRPVIPPSQCFRTNPKNGKVIRFISDQQTKCFYWECTSSRPVPKQCGLQTFISEFFEGDEYNPCTEMYTDLTMQFDCTRKGFDPNGNPICKKIYEDSNTCQNDGRVATQGNLCWCECRDGFSGSECASRDDATDTASTNGELGTNASRDRTSAQVVDRNTQQLGVPPTIIIENSDDRAPDVPGSPNRSPSRRLRRRKQLLLQNRLSPQTNDDDNTGPIIPDSIRRAEIPFVKTIRLDEGVDTRFSDREFAEEDSPAVSAPAQVDSNGKFSVGDPCPAGFQRDFCTEQNGCLNGGTCVNQCLGAVCMCRPPYTAGRRCESYKCINNVECMNGGTCRRGRSGINPVAICTCLPGFGGQMCETSL